MRAYLNLRYTVPERIKAFANGLKRHGYLVQHGTTNKPEPGDVLVTWNRIGIGEKTAREFEVAGCLVLVTENASWGNSFCGQRWYHIARTRHNTAGMFEVGPIQRWDNLNVYLRPFRTSGEVVILPQRGIGSPPTAMPKTWPQKAVRRYGGRVRRHPGRNDCVPLAEDLKDAGKVITWGSGAAIKALMMGIPVVSEMPDWIGEQDNTEEGRRAMFRRLAWAQWTLEEIASGKPFEHLL